MSHFVLCVRVLFLKALAISKLAETTLKINEIKQREEKND